MNMINVAKQYSFIIKDTASIKSFNWSKGAEDGFINGSNDLQSRGLKDSKIRVVRRKESGERLLTVWLKRSLPLEKSWNLTRPVVPTSLELEQRLFIGNFNKERFEMSHLFPLLQGFSLVMERQEELKPKKVAITNRIPTLKERRWETSIRQTLWAPDISMAQMGLPDSTPFILLTWQIIQLTQISSRINRPYLCVDIWLRHGDSWAVGAAMYATRRISDKHLRLAYAIRYKTRDKDIPFACEIIFEKGESYPFEKTYRITPAKTLGEQKQIYLELFEVPDKYIVRRWEREGSMEFIKQVIKPADDMALKDLRIITLYYDEPVEDYTKVVFCVDEASHLKIRYGSHAKDVDTGVRLQ